MFYPRYTFSLLFLFTMKHIKTKKQLEKLGYTYQPLFANDIPCANKELECYHIWAWLDKTKDIDVTGIGFSDEVDAILEFYVNNKDKMKTSLFFKNYTYLQLLFQKHTYECILDEVTDEPPPEGYRKLVLVQDITDQLIEELKLITQ